MSLKITKDRSNIDNIELEESVVEFIENINKGISSSFNGLSESKNSSKDTLYKWDSSYKAIMNDITYNGDYNSWYE